MRTRIVAVGLTLLPALALPALADWPSFGRALVTAPGDQLGPVIASDGAGGAIVAWHDRRRFPFNIDVEHVLASGAVDPGWPVDGRALLSDVLIATIVPQGREFPAITSDGAGGVIVTWPDARNGPSGLDVFAQHVLATGVADPAWPANGLAVSSASGDQTTPVILSDGSGGAFIAWVDGRSGSTVNDLDVFAQHVLASGVVDPAWPANGTPVTTAPKAQTSPALVDDGAGGFFVLFDDLRSGNPGVDIFADHVLRTGIVDPAWPVNGRAITAAPGTQSGPRAVSDGGSGVIATWVDTRDGNNDIYAQRVLITGAIAQGWPTDGQPIATTPFSEVSPVIVKDGASGAVIAWGDARSGHHNMRAAHVLGTAAVDPTWPAGSVPLSASDCEEVAPVVASDGAGGAIVVWQQCFDIFAQHVLASGKLDNAYPENGRDVCAIPVSLQHEPDVVAAGPNGAIVTWEDTRDGLNDIYALQVLEAGTLDVPGPGVSPGISLALPRPNPTLGPVTLRFTLAQHATVSLAIFDPSGRRVRQLAAGTFSAGEHAVSWDLRDEAGKAVAGGLYLARFTTEGGRMTQKILALR